MHSVDEFADLKMDIHINSKDMEETLTTVDEKLFPAESKLATHMNMEVDGAGQKADENADENIILTTGNGTEDAVEDENKDIP